MRTYILFIILILSCISFTLIEKYKEPIIFNKYPQMYPIQDLDNSCKKLGYKIASMPTKCIKKGGSYDLNSNCKCMDDNNYCTVCYDSINIKTHNYNLVQSIKNRNKNN